ncbi:MAG: hydroxyethylthiazole kinase [Rhizobiales bacterium]|nr:hydroxyethylthiazole kinase [Hyphomicrobiales bacterium]
MRPGDLPDIAIAVLERVRTRAPRVHCITNTVAQTYTANMLLAAGAVPSMTTAAEEVGAFAAGADALLVNLGTLDPERGVAIDRALSALTGQPWVLDPVFVDRAATRAAFAASLLARRPAVVRLNRAELMTLAAGQDQAAFAAQARSIVAVSGATDTITDGARTLSLGNGHLLMAKVTAMGCAGSALLAACLAVEPDRFQAAASALLLFGIAGEAAAQHARGPGSFAIAIIDALAALDRDTVLRLAKVTA